MDLKLISPDTWDYNSSFLCVIVIPWLMREILATF